MATADVQRLAGTIGLINGYTVAVLGDAVAVFRGEEEIAREQVDGLGRFVASARDLRTGWGRFPDDAEVIFLYDKGDDCFGYAINLDWPDGSEWGYAPFAP